MIGIISISILILAIASYLQIKRTNPKKIFNVYTQPGKWFYPKYISFLAILWIRRLKMKLNKIDNKSFERRLEQIKELSEDPKAFDAVFFHGVSHNGFYLCGGLEKRHNGKSNGLFYLLVPDLGLLESPKLPKTSLNTDTVALLTMMEYSAEGIRIVPKIPMQKLLLSYKGQMKLHNNPEKLVNVQFEAEFSSSKPYFLFERDLSAKCLAKAIATEEWSKEFFEDLQKTQQFRFEQMGTLTGTLIIDNQEYQIEMASFRDHCFGFKRDWSLLHRYIYHMLYLDNNTCVAIGIVSQPCTVSSLLVGFVVHPEKNEIEPIEDSTLKLYKHGENGNPPKDLAFTFTTNEASYDVKIERIEFESVHYKGNDVEAKLIERFFLCEMNGIKGRGISEWHYNNLGRFK